MKKQEYWAAIRAEYVAKEGEWRNLDNYARDYFRVNGVLPDDFMPENDENHSRGNQVLRDLWDRREHIKMGPTFVTAMLDAYEKYFHVSDWSYFSRHDYGPFFTEDTAVIPQLRRIAHRAILSSKQYKDEKDKPNGFAFLCREYCRLKVRADGRKEGYIGIFANCDLLSLISEQLVSCEMDEALAVLKATTTDDPSVWWSKDDASACVQAFLKDIKPLLIGKLIASAKTFSAWKKVFEYAHATDRDTKVFAIYHMQSKAKSLAELVTLWKAAHELELASIEAAAKLTWKDECSKLPTEKLMKLPDDAVLNQQFIRDLILSKCED